VAILRRPNTNYIPGRSIAITKADDPALDAVDVTISGTAPVLFNGSGPPSSGLGANGDYYLDRATGLWYQKQLTGPTFRSAASATAGYPATVSSWTCAKPAGVQAGDLLLAGIYGDASTGVNAATGWLPVGVKLTGGFAGFGSVLNVYYRIADGTEGSSFTFAKDAAGDSIWSGSILAYAAGLAPEANVSSVLAANPPVVPGVTTLTPNALVLLLMAGRGTGGNIFAAATGYAERVNYTSSNGLGEQNEWQEKVKTTPGASGSATVPRPNAAADVHVGHFAISIPQGSGWVVLYTPPAGVVGSAGSVYLPGLDGEDGEPGPPGPPGPKGDTGPTGATGGGGGGGSSSVSVVQVGHGFAVGDVVKLTGATTYAKAKADSAANAEVAGIVSAVADSSHFTLTTNGQVTGLSGLTAGSLYFLSDATAGLLTATEPTTVGSVSKPLLLADATTSGLFYNFRGLVVASGTGGGGGPNSALVIPGSGASGVRPLFDVVVGRGNPGDPAAPAASIDSNAILGGSIPTGAYLRLFIYGRGDTAATSVNIKVQFNGDTGANYDWELMIASSTTTAAAEGIATNLLMAELPAASAPANVFTSIEALIQNHANAVGHKHLTYLGGGKRANASGQINAAQGSGYWRDASAITRIVLTPQAGNLIAGTRVRLEMGTP
jgi:hypothetical protein